MPEEAGAFIDGNRAEPAGDEEFVPTEIDGLPAVIASGGLGKVHAAMTAAMLVERWSCRALVSAGTAGALNASLPMQVIVGAEIIQHDYGRSRGSGQLELYRPGLPPLPDYADIDYRLTLPQETLSGFRRAAEPLEFVRFGTYVSGDTFVNDPETKRRMASLGAAAVDMECAAVAQVANHLSVPWLVAKGISDDASAISHEAFLEGLAEAARRSAQVVRRLLPILIDA